MLTQKGTKIKEGLDTGQAAAVCYLAQADGWNGLLRYGILRSRPYGRDTRYVVVDRKSEI